MKNKKKWQEQSRVKRRQWQAHIQAWGKSGLPQNEYCRQHKISSSQFCYWKKKLKQTKRDAVTFVPVPVPACTTGQQSDDLIENSSGLTIFLKSGIRIGLDNHFNVRALADAVSVLEA